MWDYTPGKTYAATSVIRRDVFDVVWSRIRAVAQAFAGTYNDLRCDELDWDYRFVHPVEEAVENGEKLGACVHHYVHVMKSLDIASRSTMKTLVIVSLRFVHETALLSAHITEIGDAGPAVRDYEMGAALTTAPKDGQSFAVGVDSGYFVALNKMMMAWKKNTVLRLNSATHQAWKDECYRQKQAEQQQSEAREDHTGPLAQIVEFDLVDCNDAKKEKEEEEEEETADVEVAASAPEVPGTETTTDRSEAKRIFKKFAGCDKEDMSDDELLQYARAKQILRTTSDEEEEEAPTPASLARSIGSPTEAVAIFAQVVVAALEGMIRDTDKGKAQIKRLHLMQQILDGEEWDVAEETGLELGARIVASAKSSTAVGDALLESWVRC